MSADRSEFAPSRTNESAFGIGHMPADLRVSVELRGLEPLTFSLRTRRATNCATAPERRVSDAVKKVALRARRSTSATRVDQEPTARCASVSSAAASRAAAASSTSRESATERPELQLPGSLRSMV